MARSVSGAGWQPSFGATDELRCLTPLPCFGGAPELELPVLEVTGWHLAVADMDELLPPFGGR